MDAPEPLPDRQRAGRVNRSPTVWERKAADAAAQAYANSPAAREINRLSKELAAIQQKFRNMRGENGINVLGEGEVITIIRPKEEKGGQGETLVTLEYYDVLVGLMSGQFHVENSQVVTSL